MVDGSIAHPSRLIEDALPKVGKFIFPIDITMLDIKGRIECRLILGRPFLAASAFMINVLNGILTLKVRDEKLQFTEGHEHVIYDAKVVECLRVETCPSKIDLVSNFEKVNLRFGQLILCLRRAIWKVSLDRKKEVRVFQRKKRKMSLMKRD